MERFFECKKYHGKCQARCCGIIPIPRKIWQKNQHKVQKKVLEKHKVEVTNPQTKQKTRGILPITQDMLCPFLKKDLSCAIYEDRPDICKKFGDETHLMLCCPMQQADGTERTEAEMQEFEHKVNEFFNEKPSKMQIMQ
jgi:Fe-S-cluster containining protein